MSTLDLSPSARKFIRMEKARIRRQFWDIKKQEELIAELYKKFLARPVANKQGEPEPQAKKSAPRTKAKAVKSKKTAKV